MTRHLGGERGRGSYLSDFSAIAAYFLITEHRAHLALAVPYLPWLLLAACPLMHLFMHHGHGGHSEGGQDSGRAEGPHQH